jgi:hypothetical protein
MEGWNTGMMILFTSEHSAIRRFAGQENPIIPLFHCSTISAFPFDLQFFSEGKK